MGEGGGANRLYCPFRKSMFYIKIVKIFASFAFLYLAFQIGGQKLISIVHISKGPSQQIPFLIGQHSPESHPQSVSVSGLHGQMPYSGVHISQGPPQHFPFGKGQHPPEDHPQSVSVSGSQLFSEFTVLELDGMYSSRLWPRFGDSKFVWFTQELFRREGSNFGLLVAETAAAEVWW